MYLYRISIYHSLLHVPFFFLTAKVCYPLCFFFSIRSYKPQSRLPGVELPIVCHHVIGVPGIWQAPFRLAPQGSSLAIMKSPQQHSPAPYLTDTSLLAPIGRHRSAHITPSKGRRSKKRKRHEGRSEPHPPPAPDLTRHITVGVNSTTRHLEHLAQAAAPNQQPQAAAADEADAPHAPESLRHLPLIFTLQPPSSITTSHLPLLTQTASRSLPASESARLVPLKPASEAKLAAALGLPRVGVIGIMDDAPGARPLLEYARQKVPAMDVPWLREACEARYLDVNVLTEHSGMKAGPKR